jgi:hypothetical protein
MTHNNFTENHQSYNNNNHQERVFLIIWPTSVMVSL